MCGKNTFDKIVFVRCPLRKINGYVNLFLQIEAIKIQCFYMSKMKYFRTRLIINTLNT